MAAYIPPHLQSKKKKKNVVKNLVVGIGSRVRRGNVKNPSRSQKVVIGPQRGWKFKKWIRAGCGLALVGCFLLGVGLGGGYLLKQSDIFRLTEVKVYGNAVISAQQVQEIAGLEQGTNLLKYDPAVIERRLVAHPWVDSANIRKYWPSTVELTIKEHRPLALINLAGETGNSLYYVDKAGNVFSAVNETEDVDFPVITGPFIVGEFENSRFSNDSLTYKAFRLLKLAEKGHPTLPIHAISELNIDPQQGLVLYLVDWPFPIYFGQDGFRKKYFRLIKILEHLYGKEQVENIKEIRMDYSDNKVLVAKKETDR